MVTRSQPLAARWLPWFLQPEPAPAVLVMCHVRPLRGARPSRSKRQRVLLARRR